MMMKHMMRRHASVQHTCRPPGRSNRFMGFTFFHHVTFVGKHLLVNMGRSQIL